MMTQTHNQRYQNRWKQLRTAFVIAAILLVFIGAVIWILNIENLLTGPWSSIASVVFTVLGVITALLQWHSPPSADASMASLDLSMEDTEPQGIQTQMKGNSSGIDRCEGTLIVYTKRNLRGATVNLNRGFEAVNLKTHLASNVVKRKKNGRTIFTSVFPALEPGNYTAYVNSRILVAKVTVLPGQVTEIDWR